MAQNILNKCLQKYRSCIHILASLYVVILNSQAVQSGNVTADASITVLLNSTVSLTWRIDLDKDQVVSFFALLVLPDEVNIVMLGSTTPPGQAVQQRGKTLFEDRISATYSSTEKLYTAELNNVQYKEKYKFKLEVRFRNPIEEKYDTIKITDVTGSPETCSESLKPAYNITENVSLTVTQDICGHPKPIVEWKLENDKFIGSFSSVLINNASKKYRYSLTTRNMVRSYCGKEIMYNGRNEFGNVRGNSTIYISFKPSKITLTSSYRYNASCVYLTWKREDTGNCLLTYHLKFDDKEDVYSTFKTNFSLCHSRCTSILSIWASYKGNTSGIFDVTIHSITPRPDTTIMPSFTTTSKGKFALSTDDCQYASKIAIAVVTNIVIGLILNIVLFVILKNKGFLQFNKNPKKTLQHPEQRDDDNYEVTETTSSHYADLNVKSLKPSIYADLTKTSDSSKQYAEIELNDTKQNMYANINT